MALVLDADSEEQTIDGRLVAQGSTVDFAGEAGGEGGTVVPLRLQDSVVGVDNLLASEAAILEFAKAFADRDCTVEYASIVRKQRGTAGNGIDGLREKDPDMSGIDVLGFIKEAGRRLNLAGSNSDSDRKTAQGNEAR